jgi:hypothetical protein
MNVVNGAYQITMHENTYKVPVILTMIKLIRIKTLKDSSLTELVDCLIKPR